ncbi:MAG TPA: acetyl-CoA carboxylase biotin carboxyl carrier protein [Planctomycetota bacterium]|nr:acetyl-CoA carboxylase biotin carboxyl carrier protein [Planctomycetota bacterium]
MAARKKTTGARTRGTASGGSGVGASRKGARKAGARSGSRAGGQSAGTLAGRFPDIEELVELMNRHELLEVDYHVAPDGSRRIKVSRAGSGQHAGAPSARALRAAAHAAETAEASVGPGPAAPAAPAAVAPAPGETLHAFKSPMVGTFYRAPSPEAPPFVSVGDKLDPHATVCIIEAMKVMNEITPDVSGTVVSIEVENGEAVEFGQTLFLVRPN